MDEQQMPERHSPVTHMPEKLYMSSATMSISSTMAMGLEWKIICTTQRKDLSFHPLKCCAAIAQGY